MSDYIMSFGKYAGVQLVDIPTNYFQWLDRECDLREPLKSHVAEELSSRPSPSKRPPKRRAEPAIPSEVLERWYMDLRGCYGTDLDAMRIVTDCYRRLTRLLAKPWRE